MILIKEKTKDGCKVVLNTGNHKGREVESVEYDNYGGAAGYITFYDNSGNTVVYSTNDLDQLIEALEILRAEVK